MTHEKQKTTVELPISDVVSTGSVEVPLKQAEIYRQMKINDTILITDESKRQAAYNNAIRAFRTAQFATRKIEGSVYLVRTA